MTMWSFAIFGTYRAVHCSYVLYLCYKNGVKEWFSICVPVGIIVYTLTCYLFIVYVDVCRRGHQWPKIYIYGVFAL